MLTLFLYFEEHALYFSKLKITIKQAQKYYSVTLKQRSLGLNPVQYSTTPFQGLRRRQVTCVSELDGVLLPESVCREDRPQEEEVCILQQVCHNSLPQTAQHARNSLDRVEAKGGAERAAPTPKTDASIWRIGDWGMVS